MRPSISKFQSYYRTSLYKNAFYLIANTPVASVLGFIFWIAVARFYSPVDVGLAAALISAANLLAVFSNLGFNFSVIKFLPGTKDFNSLINSCLTVIGIVSFFLAAIFLLLSNFLSPALLFVRERSLYFFAFLVISTVWAISPLIDNIFVAIRASKFVLVRNTIFNVLKIPLAVYFLAFFGAFGIFASWGAAMIIANSLALMFFIQKSWPGFSLAPTINMPVISEMRYFSIGNYIAYILYIAPNFLLPLVIINLLGAQANAYFYVTFMIAELIFIIPTAVSQSLFAEGSNRKEGTGEYTQKSLKIIYLLMIPAILVIILIGDKLLLLFGGDYSEHGTRLLQIFAISALFLGINVVYMTVLRLEKKVTEVIAISGFLALGILSLTYGLLLSTENILFAGYSWLLFHAALSFYAMWSMYTKVLKVPSGAA